MTPLVYPGVQVPNGRKARIRFAQPLGTSTLRLPGVLMSWPRRMFILLCKVGPLSRHAGFPGPGGHIRQCVRVPILQVSFNEVVSIGQHPRGKVAVSIQRRLMQAGRLALVATKKCNCGDDNQLAVRIHYYLCVVIWSEPILTCSRDAALGIHEVALALAVWRDRRGIC